MKAKGRMYLKVIGIIYIVLGVFSLIGVAGLLFINNNTQMQSSLAASGAPTSVPTSTIIMSIILVVLYLAAGVLGIKFCNDPEHANVNLILGILLLVFEFISIIIARRFSLGSILYLILIVLYLLGAYYNKKTDLNEFNEVNNY